MTLEVVSLFSGVGGFDLGFERAGMKVVAQAENDPKAAGVLQRHWPNARLYGDVHDIGKEWAGVDVVCGGFPCQDISVAGKQKGIARGDKSVLWWEFYRIIEELRPRWVVIENVANLLNINEGRDLGAIIGSLDDLGYMGEWRVLDSQFFGVPQRRRRVFLVGYLGGGSRPAVLLEPESGARDLEAGSEEGSRSAAEGSEGSLGGRREVIGTLTTAFNSKNYSNLQEVLSGSIIPVPPAEKDVAGPLLAGASGRGYRIGVEEAASKFIIPTYAFAENQRSEVRSMDTFSALVQSGGKAGQGYPAVREPMGVRRLTPRECERLQGFPDDWTLLDVDGKEVADTHRYRFMGNAVTVNVTEWIGRRLVISDQSVGE